MKKQKPHQDSRNKKIKSRTMKKALRDNKMRKVNKVMRIKKKNGSNKSMRKNSPKNELILV